MKTKKIFYIFFMLLVCRDIVAQGDYRAMHWDIENGLSHGIISRMLKDVNGFLWLSTDYGLSRFDGNSFKNYFGDKNSNKTVIDNDTKLLIEDSLHNIWIGTRNGASRYDIKADSFKHFLPDAKTGNAVMLPFWATNDNVYCIESSKQITAYNTHSLAKRTLIQLTPADNVGDGMAVLYSIFDAGSNSVWMLEGRPGEPGGGLYQIFLSTGKREHYQWPCYKKIHNHSHWSEAMCYDRKRNAIWINSPDGLIQFTINDKSFHHVTALNKFVQLKNYERAASIDLDPTGRIWLPTYPNGIIIYDPSSQLAILPFPRDSVLRQDVADANLSIYCDRDGMVWTGFWLQKGLYQLIPFSQAVKEYFADTYHAVINYVNGDKGKLWMGTLQGLTIFDPRADSYVILHEKDLPGLKGERIIPVGIDTLTQKAWLHTERSFFEMDIRTKHCRRIIFQDSAHHIIEKVNVALPLFYGGYCQYKNGCFIPVFHDGRAALYYVKSDSAIAWRIPLPYSIAFNNTCTTNDEFLFLKSEDGFMLTYTYSNGEWIRSPTPFDSVKISRIIYNKIDKSYWVITAGELYHYNKNFQLIRRYTQDGLPPNEIYAVIADNIGNVWFNTDRSIAQLNVMTGKITVLTEKDGFKKRSFSPGTATIKDVFGGLYFASGVRGGEGFVRISPSKLQDQYPPSSVYIRSIDVNQHPLSFPTGINTVNGLSLKHFENDISIETGVIDYYSKGANRIRYKLEGINNSWQLAPVNYTIRYAGLSPAKYTLVIQASNAANDFNGPMKSIFIRITPPFWQTWWFRLIIVFAASMVLVWVFRSRINSIRKEAAVKNQLLQLEMKALKAQIDPHFIYNSLNSIQSLVTDKKDEEAVFYIGSFSRLLRQVLHNSDASVTTLEKELENLKLYVNLESLRLNMDLSYSLQVGESIMPELVKVPPLILQPFVENAIWHGLNRKEGSKKIDITIHEKDNILTFAIRDNGVGRQFASSLRSATSSFNKSYGIEITTKRLTDFNLPLTLPPVSFTDLTDDEGNASGTLVTIRIRQSFTE